MEREVGGFKGTVGRASEDRRVQSGMDGKPLLRVVQQAKSNPKFVGKNRSYLTQDLSGILCPQMLWSFLRC